MKHIHELMMLMKEPRRASGLTGLTAIKCVRSSTMRVMVARDDETHSHLNNVSLTVSDDEPSQRGPSAFF